MRGVMMLSVMVSCMFFCDHALWEAVKQVMLVLFYHLCVFKSFQEGHKTEQRQIPQFSIHGGSIMSRISIRICANLRGMPLVCI